MTKHKMTEPEMVSAYIERDLVPARKNIKEVTGYSYTSFLRAGFTIGALLKLVPKKEKPKKFCEWCNSEIKGKSKRFCSQSCAASYLNRQQLEDGTHISQLTKNLDNYNTSCLNCGKELENKKSRYCSFHCSQAHKSRKAEAGWLSGDIPGWAGVTVQLKRFVKRYLHRTRGTACEVCGWDERHPVDGAVLTEIDHIDGDAKNCSPENLRILCPNCHSKTPTHRARNKNSQRKRK